MIYWQSSGYAYGMHVDNCGESCQSIDANYLAWEEPGIGRRLIILAAHGCVWLFIRCFLESETLSRVERLIINILRRKQDVGMATVDHGVLAAATEDSDVAAERERIVRTPVERLATTDAVILRQLTKFYGRFLAVDRLSVGIPHGQYISLSM